MKRSSSRIAAATSILVASAALSVPANAEYAGPTAGDAPPDRAPMVLGVDASQPIKRVDHAASGALYGLGDEGWPGDEWIAPIKPKMFTQPPPGATHLPNGEPEPVGDALKVWKTAKRHGATVTAESGQWSGASLVKVDMAQSNFSANYVSGNAYVRGLSQPTSNLRLPVTVPAAGTYRLKIGYSTAGTEAERRAQTKAGHILRVNDGPWQHVSYEPTQFRELVRHTWVTVDLPAGTSTITLAKDHPDYPGETQPGTVDLDYIDVVLVH